MKWLTYLLYLSILIFSISNLFFPRAKDKLEEALILAGENRSELEKVLNHYSGDSLKYRAACFLIENMPYYYSVSGDYIDTLEMTLRQFCKTGYYDKQRFLYSTQYSCEGLSIIKDIEVIKAEYLIENIDYSFKVWNEKPWGKYIKFTDFCEYILPYRIKNEPLTNWKRNFYNKYNSILDSLYEGSDVVEACSILNSYVNNNEWNYIKELSGIHLSAEFIEKYRVGSCEEMSDYTVYVMRSVGIPVVKDMYFFSPDQMYGHCWNALLDTTGHNLSFFCETANPQRNKQLFYTKGKVYRRYFSLQNERLNLLRDGFFVPSPLNDFSLIDVSSDYFPTGQIIVDCGYVPFSKSYPVYIAVFSPWGWIPSDVGCYKDGFATFKNVESGFYYATLYYDKLGNSYPAGPAFKLDPETGEVVYMRPNEGKKRSVTLRRKYPMVKRRYGFLEHMKGGRFEASMYKDFHSSILLKTIDTVPKPFINEIKFPIDYSYRYVRYISSNDNPADIAELYWANDEDTLKGKLLYTLPEKKTKEFSPYNIIDGDNLTYYTSADKPGWIGMDFGSKRSFNRILFLPRNDENYIISGHKYELFYWSKLGWKSLGCKIANTDVLVYDNAPEYALFWLRDLTSGKEEQVFVYYNDKQYFNKREMIY